MDKVIDVIPIRVNSSMNRRLIRSSTELEVHEALMAMHPTKAPGGDGMTALIFQKYWSIFGADITAAIQGFFHGGHLLRSLN